MYDSLVFYNHFGAGDLWESRGFIKEIMLTVEANEYYYCHTKNSRMFSDIPNLKYNPVDSRMQEKSAFAVIDNRLFINTWIGRDSKYVLPRVGCVIDKNYDMFNDTLSSIGIPKLSKQFIEYLPTVDYAKLNTGGITKFINKRKNRRKVLVCNGNVNSMQADNFSFEDVIYRLSIIFKDIDFLVTQELPIKSDNIFHTGSIINSSDGFDLNEISYLANHVDVIVGRKSGPFVFAHNKDVWFSNKKSLSFTYEQHSSHFVLGNDLPLKKYWSSETDVNSVTKRIVEVINE